MRFPKSLFQRMPYVSQAACTLSELCDAPAFPNTDPVCGCETMVGGIPELYFIPCTEIFDEASITSVEYWQGLINAGTLGRSGLGLGSIGKKTDKKDRTASCRSEQITSITWALKFTVKCFDKTVTALTNAVFTELINRADKYYVVARMCEGDDRILPIGQFDATDIDWTVPETSEDNQSAMIELSWKELALPKTVVVAGLSTVLPKTR